MRFLQAETERAPGIIGMDHKCDRDYRDDGKSVVFMELGKARNVTEG